VEGSRLAGRRTGAGVRTPVGALPALGLLLIVGVLALGVGSVGIAPETIVRILAAKVTLALGGTVDAPTWTTGQETIVTQIRLPRVILASLVGAALAVSGAIYQGLFRNPMGDPYLLGVAPGASLGAMFLLAFGAELGLLWTQLLPAAAFAGAAGATVIIYSLARVDRTTPVTTLLLAGVALGAVLSALTSLLMYARPEKLQMALGWLFGSFSRSGWDQVDIALPYVVVGLALALVQARPLNLLLLDEDQARNLGVDVERTKIVLIIAATLLAAASVAVSGLIGFVGLIAPHTARLIWGPDYRRLLPSAAFVGALFLVLADLFARTAFSPQEVPVGIVSALCGGPFFLWLLRQRRRVAS
jgi:iron complex transport system permease protein